MALITLTNLALTLLAAATIHLIYTAIHRLFLSPLSSIPGPRLAALTSWYKCYYDVYRPAQYIFKIKSLHAKYGPIVRITPREISISDLSFLDTIYLGKRDKDAEKVRALGVSTSIGGAVDWELHRRRREPLNTFFSRRSVLGLATRLEDTAAQLRQIFERGAEDMSDLYTVFTSDVVSQYAFGHNQNVLANQERGAEMRKNIGTVLRGVKVNLQFPWIRDGVRRLPKQLVGHWTPDGVKDMIRFRMKIREEILQIIKGGEKGVSISNSLPRSIFHHLLSSPSLPPEEKTLPRLEDEATLLVMAGTESTAKSINLAHYYILANPSLMAKLRDELKSKPSEMSEELFSLPYMSAIAIEAYRLSFGLTGRNPRVAPNEEMIYTNPTIGKSYHIPPGTPVSTSTLLAHTNENIFSDPWAFNPDRWLGKEGQEKKKYMLSFGKGPRMCIGRELA
ncbi:cytochrome P450, partial [Halenospora varia]